MTYKFLKRGAREKRRRRRRQRRRKDAFCGRRRLLLLLLLLLSISPFRFIPRAASDFFLSLPRFDTYPERREKKKKSSKFPKTEKRRGEASIVFVLPSSPDYMFERRRPNTFEGRRRTGQFPFFGGRELKVTAQASVSRMKSARWCVFFVILCTGNSFFSPSASRVKTNGLPLINLGFLRRAFGSFHTLESVAAPLFS